MTDKPIQVLLVEDNPGDVRLIREMLLDATVARFELEPVDRVSTALDRLAAGGIDLILLDLLLPDSEGLDTFTRMWTRAPGLPIVVLSGLNDEVAAAHAVRLGAQDYLVKGQVDGNLLERSLRYALERKRAEGALQASEARFRSVVESASDAIIQADDGGTIVAWNKGAEAIFGYTERERLGKPLTDLMPERYREAHLGGLERARQSSEPELEGKTVELQGVRKDGGEFPLELSLAVWQTAEGRFYTAIVRDLTVRKQLEKQLLQSQRLEAIGQLAGGVAHDFNNILTVILGHSQILLSELHRDDTRRQDIGEIDKAGQRAASLTRQLLAFSRQQILAPRVLDLNQVVADVQKMLGRVIGEDIGLVTRLDPALGCVKADPGQVEQILLNLSVNARDAMPEGGELTVETANVDLDEGYSVAHGPVIPGRYVLLAVSDTGVGMEAETQTRIFEPFFTTKEKGQGTGLGLSTVYGIVKQSGGNIWVYSEPGQGTTFKIYLPRVEEAVESRRPSDAARATPQGEETVLVVEDEEAVRTMARRVLRDRGYRVLEAGDGEEALEICGRQQGVIHLMITDVVMPGMSSRRLVERLGACHPETTVLYMSGYTDDTIVRRGVLKPGIQFLQKPFTPNSLAQKVRQVLDAPEHGLLEIE